MAGAIGKFPLGDARVELEVFDHLVTLPDGDVTVVYKNGRVRKVGPDGTVGTSDPGSVGTYERARVNGGVITYCPDTPDDQITPPITPEKKWHPWDFSFAPKVPNL